MTAPTATPVFAGLNGWYRWGQWSAHFFVNGRQSCKTKHGRFPHTDSSKTPPPTSAELSRHGQPFGRVCMRCLKAFRATVRSDTPDDAEAKDVAIEEADIQKAIPGAKAYWNANGLPSILSGACRIEFLDVAGRRYQCEAAFGHFSSQHAATGLHYDADGRQTKVWKYGTAEKKDGRR